MSSDPITTAPSSDGAPVAASTAATAAGPFMTTTSGAADSLSLQSLFSNDEARFIQDSFNSAHSFDPFQHGTPGFKVPAVLPQGLIHSLALGSMPNAPRPPQPSERSRNNSWAPGSSHEMNARPFQAGPQHPFDSSLHPQQAPPPHHPHHAHSVSQDGLGQFQPQQGAPFHPHLAHSASQGAFPNFMPNLHAASPAAGQPPIGHSQSFSGPSTWAPPGSSPPTNPTGGAYGRNRAWQMQQMEALQAERRRYMQQVQPGDEGDADVGQHPPQGQGAQDAGPWAQQQPGHPARNTHHGASRSFSHASDGHTDLSMLGLTFPSSHDFPAPSPPGGQPPGPSIDSLMAQQDGNGDFEMADQGASAGPSKRRRQGTNAMGDGPDAMMASSDGRGRSPTSRPPWSQPPTAPGAGPGSSMPGPSKKRSALADDSGRSASIDDRDVSMARSESNSNNNNIYKPWPKAPSPSQPSDLYPPLHLDTSLVAEEALLGAGSATSGDNSPSRRLRDAFYGRDPAEERRRIQPHLVDLKERRREERKRRHEMIEEKKRKALERQKLAAGSSMSPDLEESSDSKDGNKAGGSKAKQPHVLLTEAEKKANHIASEQKRRANIRKGYEMLCSGVPALREALDRDKEAGVDDSVDEKGNGQGGVEVSGERIDGRAGPRSEAVVLGKSVEHLRHLLEVHRDLRARRDHARAKLAYARLGVNIVVSAEEAAERERARAKEEVGKQGSGKGKGKAGGGGGGKDSAKKGAPAPNAGKGSSGKGQEKGGGNAKSKGKGKDKEKDKAKDTAVDAKAGSDAAVAATSNAGKAAADGGGDTKTPEPGADPAASASAGDSGPATAGGDASATEGPKDGEPGSGSGGTAGEAAPMES